MPKLKNEAIGECPCPTKGCALTCKVFKFRGRANVLQQRLAGKLYLHCEAHGRYGADGKPGAQEFILENADIWDEKNRAARVSPPANELAPASQPAPIQSALAAAPDTATPKRPSVWDL